MADTYYIGSEAAAVEVQQIVSMGDSLYAFSYDKMYLASIKDNLVDYTFWHSQNIPCEKVQQALVWRDAIYTLQHDSLYRREGTVWQQVVMLTESDDREGLRNICRNHLPRYWQPRSIFTVAHLPQTATAKPLIPNASQMR